MHQMGYLGAARWAMCTKYLNKLWCPLFIFAYSIYHIIIALGWCNFSCKFRPLCHVFGAICFI